MAPARPELQRLPERLRPCYPSQPDRTFQQVMESSGEAYGRLSQKVPGWHLLLHGPSKSKPLMFARSSPAIDPMKFLFSFEIDVIQTI